VIRALLATALVGGLVLAGCGSDGSGETTQPSVSIPAITSPIPATSTTTPALTTTPTQSTTRTGSGGSGGGPPGADPGKPDSETNDLPPPAGSPQDAFEKQCNQNPRACG
jgi:hypothetical protein